MSKLDAQHLAITSIYSDFYYPFLPVPCTFASWFKVNPFMSKRLAALIILLAIVSVGLSQPAANSRAALQAKLDSADRIVQQHLRDSIGVNTLFWAGHYTSTKDFRASFQYFRSALYLSEKIRHQKKFALLNNRLGELHHAQGNYDSSLFFHRKAISLGIQNNDFKEVCYAYQGIALTLLWQGQLDSAKYYLKEGQAVAKNNNEYELLANIYNEAGNIFLEEVNYAEALKQYILAAELHDKVLHDPQGKSTALANIGNMQYHLGDVEKALAYTKEAQTIAKKNNLDEVLAYASQQLGRIYRKQKKIDQALVEFKKALTAYRRMGLKRNAGEVYLSIGNIYFDKRNFQEAKAHYTIAIELSKTISNDVLLTMLYYAMGSVSHELKHYKQAFLFIDSAQTVAKKINDHSTLLESYQLLAQISEEQKNYREALSYFQKYSALKDSFNNAANRKDILELEMKYQNEKKVTEIELLKSDQALKELTVSKQKVIIISTITALLLTLAIGVLLINRNKAINKAKRLVEMERMRNAIARDLHDDIGSALSSINILSQVAIMEKNGNGQNYLQRIGDQSARIMEDMSDMVWSINPRNDSMSKTIIRMREFFTELFELKNIEYNFIENVQEGLTLSVDQRKNIFLIFKEGINNAAKYSDASLVEVSLLQDDAVLILKIKDNGRGFDKNAITKGNGLWNLRERAKEINGIFTVTTTPGQGTTIELKLPIA